MRDVPLERVGKSKDGRAEQATYVQYEDGHGKHDSATRRETNPCAFATPANSGGIGRVEPLLRLRLLSSVSVGGVNSEDYEQNGIGGLQMYPRSLSVLDGRAARLIPWSNARGRQLSLTWQLTSSQSKGLNHSRGRNDGGSGPR